MEQDIVTPGRSGLAAVLMTAFSLSSFSLITGCSAGAPTGQGGASSASGVSLADIQGEWYYFRFENDQALSGDCITIEGARLTEFINGCDGEDLLSASEDITTNGRTLVLQFSLAVPVTGEANPDILDITTTLVQEEEAFTGTENGTSLAVPDDTGEYRVILRRPDPQDG